MLLSWYLYQYSVSVSCLCAASYAVKLYSVIMLCCYSNMLVCCYAANNAVMLVYRPVISAFFSYRLVIDFSYRVGNLL